MPDSGIMVTRLVHCALLFFGLASTSAAETWYVDANLGSDAFGGRSTSIEGKSGPLRSLARLTTLLMPGDKVVLVCGSVWHEPLLLRGAKNGGPIAIEPSGVCAKGEWPTIDPRRRLGNAPSGSEVGSIYVGEELLAPAQIGAPNWMRLPAQNHKGADSMIIRLPDEVLARYGQRSMVGAVLSLRTVPYRVEKRIVTADVPGVGVRINHATQYPVRAGTPLIIERIPDDAKPGWSVSSDGRVKLHSTTPVHLSTSWSPSSPAVLIQGQVKIRGIRVIHSGEDGIRIVGGPGSVVDQVEIHDSARDGIHLVDSAGSSIVRSSVSEVGRDAIRIDRSDGSVVQRNSIEGVGMGVLPTDSFAAINGEYSSGLLISGNQIRSVAYIGIRFKRSSVVEFNLLDGICKRMGDCGALMAWARLDPKPGFQSRVQRNIIRNVGSDVPEDEIGNAVAAGIYLDDLSSDVEVAQNVIENSPIGVFIHNSTGHTLAGNMVIGSRDCSICLVGGMNEEVVEAMGSNSISGNTLVPAPGGVAYRMFSRYSLPVWARFARNRVYHSEYSPIWFRESGARLGGITGKWTSSDSPGDDMATKRVYRTSLVAEHRDAGPMRRPSDGSGSGRHTGFGGPSCQVGDCESLTTGTDGVGRAGRVRSGDLPAGSLEGSVLEFDISTRVNGLVSVEIFDATDEKRRLAELARIDSPAGVSKRVILPMPRMVFSRSWRVHFIVNDATDVAVSSLRWLKAARVESSLRYVVNSGLIELMTTCAMWKAGDCRELRALDGGGAIGLVVPPFSAAIAEVPVQ